MGQGGPVWEAVGPGQRASPGSAGFLWPMPSAEEDAQGGTQCLPGTPTVVGLEAK